MKTVLFTAIIWCTSWVHSMNAKEVFIKMQDVYKNASSFEYTCKYELLKGHKSNEVTDSYSGYVYKSKSLCYQKTGQTEFVYGTDFFLQINHDEKAMLLGLAQKNILLNADMDLALKECRELKMETIGDYYHLILLIKSTSEIPYSVIRLKISKSKYHLVQIDLYYSGVQNFSQKRGEQDMHQPHLRISLDGFNTSPKVKKSVFLLENYIETEHNMLKPASKYAGYDLIDKRLN